MVGGEPPTLLKALLTERHMQSYSAFSREYVKVAQRISSELVATAPGREQYQRWLNGRVKTRPHPDHCRVLERMFPGRTVSELFERYRVAEERGSEEKENTTNRRELFESGGAVLAGAFIDRLWSEPDRMHSALDRSTVGPARLDALRREALDLGVRVIKVPPATLLGEALTGYRSTRRLIDKPQRLSAHRELVRDAGMFGTVIGEILFNLGVFPLARHYYRTAICAAQEAGDQFLADIALAGSTYLPTYTPDPRGVLEQVAPRLDARYTPTPAIAWLWGFKAKAHAMLGERTSFEKAIGAARDALEASPSSLVKPGIFSFLPEKLAFYEARGWVELDNAEKASDAAERAIALYDPTETTEPALARFEQASALAQAGEIGEACRIAAEAVVDQHTYHSITVITRAKEFDQLLGPSNNNAARDWREVLNSLRAPNPALAATVTEPK